jgi:MSHA biogenesis protein MshK
MAILLLTVWVLSVQAQELRVQDPTRPTVPARAEGGDPTADSSLRLTGVLVSDTRRIAVINGRFYRVGDRVNGEEIIRIDPGSIRIMRGGEQVRVTVKNAITVDNDGD